MPDEQQHYDLLPSLRQDQALSYQALFLLLRHITLVLQETYVDVPEQLDPYELAL